MYAFRKPDGRPFICGAEDVCRTRDGSTNEYLPVPRLVEDFLKLVEPQYNAACSSLAQGNPTPDAVFVCAGFAASVMACSPAAMRLSTAPLEESLKVEAELLDRAGQLPKAPPELGGKTLSELLSEGAVAFDVDQKYPQAIGISSVFDRALRYGNAHWDILLNDHPDVPFFTSDFPVAVEASGDFRVVNRVVPLSPALAIRICPQPDLAERKLKPTFEHFSYTLQRPSRSRVVDLNRTIVRSAEEAVFYPLTACWVSPFVGRNGRYRVENETTRIKRGTGFLSMTRTVLREVN